MHSVPTDPLLEALHDGRIELQGLLPWGSNYTFLATVTCGEQSVAAVYKPMRGERPLWDFPDETLARREVAAYVVSEALGWRFVPPTVLRADGPHGPGSLQVYVDADPEAHYFNMTEAEKAGLRHAALFDLLVNNADRKGSHVLRDRRGQIWLIDHGICFHHEPKLRTVIWDFAGQAIPEGLLADLRLFREKLETDAGLQSALSGLLSAVEFGALKRRADGLLRAKRYPQPGAGRNFPWPPM